MAVLVKLQSGRYMQFESSFKEMKEWRRKRKTSNPELKDSYYDNDDSLVFDFLYFPEMYSEEELDEGIQLLKANKLESPYTPQLDSNFFPISSTKENQ